MNLSKLELIKVQLCQFCKFGEQCTLTFAWAVHCTFFMQVMNLQQSLQSPGQVPAVPYTFSIPTSAHLHCCMFAVQVINMQQSLQSPGQVPIICHKLSPALPTLTHLRCCIFAVQAINLQQSPGRVPMICHIFSIANINTFTLLHICCAGDQLAAVSAVSRPGANHPPHLQHLQHHPIPLDSPHVEKTQGGGTQKKRRVSAIGCCRASLFG